SPSTRRAKRCLSTRIMVGGSGMIAFADQQMNVLGHDHISDYRRAGHLSLSDNRNYTTEGAPSFPGFGKWWDREQHTQWISARLFDEPRTGSRMRTKKASLAEGFAEEKAGVAVPAFRKRAVRTKMSEPRKTLTEPERAC